MLLKSIKLTNIGPFKEDNNTFEFIVDDSSRNIILIGGKNGAGKTTLLKAIKLGLHGNYSFGLKTNSVNYYKKIYQLFNYSELKKENCKFAIDIEFILYENYIKNSYIFKRSWRKQGEETNEYFRVYKNGTIVSDYQKEIIQDKIKYILPPFIIDAVLFDGEEIAKLVDEGSIENYLKELIMVNFNLNIIDKINDDIKYYIDNEKKKAVLSTEELKIVELEKEYIDIMKKQKDDIELEAEYKKTIKENQLTLKNTLIKFQNYGGITSSQKEIIIKSLNSLELTKKDNQKLLKTFIEEDIIFYLNHDLLISIKEHIQIEKPKVLLRYVEEIEDYINNIDLSEIKSILIKDSIIDNNILLNSSKQTETFITNILKKLQTFSKEYIKNIYNSNREFVLDSKEFKDTISNNEDNKELSSLLGIIVDLESKIELLKEKYDKFLNNKEITDININNLKNKLDLLEKEYESNKKEENSFLLARKILKTANEFNKKQLLKILSRISHSALLKFNELSPKKNYIKNIEIGNEDFGIHIYDKDLTEKNMTLFSAGEKQLLISSLIWAIFNESKRDTFFVFDTPLARLDENNRKSFVKNIITNISNQVIVLSTDEEIVGDLYKGIKDRINTEFLLDNKPEENKTYINYDYFGKVK